MDLIKIADVLETSIDYLVGRVDNKNEVAQKSDINNEWGNNTLGSFDKFMAELQAQNLSCDMNAYIFVAYVNNNILEDLLNKIKNKVARKNNITEFEKHKVEFLLRYVDYVTSQKIELYEYLRFIVTRKWANFSNIKDECQKLLNYNENKKLEIYFDNIKAFKSMLHEFEEYLSFKVDTELKASKTNMIEKINKDNRYFYTIQKYFKEVENY